MAALIPIAELQTAPPPAESYAVFGGTFDPIHEGHIGAVRKLAAVFPSVVIAPTTENPWKKDAPTPLALRLEMIALALRAEQLSGTVSVWKEGYTFASELVEVLRNLRKDQLYWVAGQDIAHEVNAWKNWEAARVSTVIVPIEPLVHATDIREGTKELHPALQAYAKFHHLYGL